MSQDLEKLVAALTQLVTRPDFQGQKPAQPRTVRADLGNAPACVQELAQALAGSYYNVELGAFSMFFNGAGLKAAVA